MSTPIRALIFETCQDDVELLLHELRRAGYAPEHTHVQTEAEYLSALDESFDIILVNDADEGFNALQALSILQNRGLDIPFIVITREAREENAVECMTHGAADYLVKGRLVRLGQSVAQALQAKKLRIEKAETELALRESEARFQRLTEVAQEIVYRIRLQPTPQLEYVSSGIASILGYSPEEFYNDPLIGTKTIHPDDAALVRRVYKLEIDLNAPLIVRWRHKNGKIVWTEQYLTPLFEEDGTPIAIEGIARDITASKEAEIALRESEERYRSVVDVMAEGILVYDKDGKIMASNSSAATILGTPLDQLIGQIRGKAPWQIVDENGQPLADEERPSYRALHTGQPQSSDLLAIKRADNSLRYISTNAQALFRPGETAPYGSVVSFSDITERKQRERELKAIASMATALRKATTVAEMLPIILDQLLEILHVEGVALDYVDPNTQEIYIASADGAWKHASGFRTPPGVGISGRVIALGHPFITDDIRKSTTMPYFSEVVGDLTALVCVPLIVEGQALGVLWAGRREPIASEDVQLLTAICEIAANALYRARLMETLEQRVTERTAKLEAVNEQLQELDNLKSKFVSDVSHELRTPITNLNSYLYLLDRGKPEHFPRYKAVLKEQVNRLTSLLDTILDLSRLDLGTAKIDFAEVDVNDVVEQVVLAHIPRADAATLRLELDLATELPTIWGERNQLAQVVTNLVSNALNYTRKGEIYVSTYWDREHDKVCLRVEDTGMGIEAEDLPHLFERFYRGKQAGSSNIPGSGLGLGIVKEIVDLHRGKIDVKSQIGVGSTFQIVFPINHRPS